MTLREIIEKYEVGKKKKYFVAIMVPNDVVPNVRQLISDGYLEEGQPDNMTLFYLFDVPSISKRTGLDFNHKM